MNTSRLAGIPIDHVVAEVAAFPLCAEAALEGGLFEFNPKMVGSTEVLWHAAERHVLSNFPSFSVEEAVTVRDSIWFDLNHGDDQNKPVSLGKFLQNLAHLYLEPRGDDAVPSLPRDRDDLAPLRRGPREVVARIRWRWLSFALPPDLLLAALGRHSQRQTGASDPDGTGNLTATPASVEFLSPTLDRTLRDQGFAETHCHIGESVSSFPCSGSEQ